MKKGMLGYKFKIIGLVLYFVILFAERLMAVIFSFNQGGVYALKSGSYFNYAAYGVTVISLIVGTILAIKPLIGMLGKLFSKEQYDFEKNYKSVVISAMALLYGGMMHTGFTLAPMQFVAYGFLIATMVVRCVEKCIEDNKSAFPSIVSVIYLTLFSMTVPVCYIALKLRAPQFYLFYIAEFAAAFILIPVFGIMLLKFYKNGVTSFSFVYPLIMLILSGSAVLLKCS